MFTALSVDCYKTHSRSTDLGHITPKPKLFLSNVKNGVSIATIKEWLKKKNINFVGLYRKSKEHYVHQSFVITVTNETYNKVFDEALWPPGVTVREYGPPIRQDG